MNLVFIPENAKIKQMKSRDRSLKTGAAQLTYRYSDKLHGDCI